MKDNRGKKQKTYKRPEILEGIYQSIRDHVNRIPKVEAHYLRKDSTKTYISGELNKSEMYRLYVECMRYTLQSSSAVVATERQYLYILKTEFPKLGFFVPKKDKCDECVKNENLKIPRDEGDFKVHLDESKLAQNSKKEDKEKAKQNPEAFLMAIFDFQKILILPFGDISSFYYKRNLHFHNFTVYSAADREAFCYTWLETEGKKDAIEVSSAFYNSFNFN